MIRFSKSFIAGQIFFVLLIGLFCVNPDVGSCFEVDFIYINSSVGEAAGGHAAIRLDQNVYHFQLYEEGYFLLVKQGWKDFRFEYNDLQNRTLYIVSIPVDEDIFHQIQLQFNRRLLVQENKFSQLAQLHREATFWKSGQASLQIPGLGYFVGQSPNNSSALQLRQQIVEHLGDDFFLRQSGYYGERNCLEGQLLEPPEINGSASLYTSDIRITGSFQSYYNGRAFTEVLRILDQAVSVDERLLFSQNDGIQKLTADQLNRLYDYRSKLVQSIISQLQTSEHVDAHALLVQTARYQALSQTLETGVLVTIDPFTDAAQQLQVAELVATKVLVRDDETSVKPVKRSYLEQLQYERKRDLSIAKHTFFTSSEDGDIAYTMLEKANGELYELQNIAPDQKLVRVEGVNQLPDKIGSVTESFEWSPEKINAYSEQIAERIAWLENLIMENYGYNLFTRNCVTELFETIYSTFNSKDEAIQYLNGYMHPGAGFSFVPFRSFDMAAEAFRTASVEILPSYRQRYLELLESEKGFWATVSESSTLLSAIYEPWEQDTVFLFFTDDVLLLRPVYGLGNILYELLAGVGGILKLPVDGGILLKRSLKGVVFSLPEIGFINIRKGTFPAIGVRN